MSESVGIANGESFACALGASSTGITYQFAIGSTVFSCAKAHKGTFEKLVIQSVRLDCVRRQVTLYTDTFNGIWTEDELCSEVDARAAVIAYLLREQAILEEALAICNF